MNRGVTSLDLRIARLYAAGVEQPTKAAIRVSTPAAPGWSAVLPLKMLPFDEPLPLPILVDGDHTFAFEDTIDGRVLRKDSITISIVDNLNSRLARLASTARNGTLAAATLEQLTLRNYVQVLIALGRAPRLRPITRPHGSCPTPKPSPPPLTVSSISNIVAPANSG